MLPLKSLDRDKGINLAQADPVGGPPPRPNLETQAHFQFRFARDIQLVGLLIVVQALQTPSQKSSNLLLYPITVSPIPGIQRPTWWFVCISRAHSLCRHDHPESHL